MAGGLSLFIAYELWQSGDRRSWVAWAAYNLVLLSSFGLLFHLAARDQTAAELGYMQNYWKDNLPSLSPLRFAGWLIVTHASELMSFPVGGERGASTLTFLVWVAGLVVALSRATVELATDLPGAGGAQYRRRGDGPISLRRACQIRRSTWRRASVWSSAREPPLCWSGTKLRTGRGRKALAIALGVLCLVPLGTMTRDFLNPYKSKTDARYRDFARWFWFNMEFEGEVACLKTDLNQNFAPGTFHDLGWSAMYLCNQKIYSPRHARREPLHLDKVSEQHPLRCVQFKAQVYKYDQAAFDRWLDSMQQRYDLVARDAYPFPCFDQRGRNLLCLDQVDVFKFVPKAGAAHTGTGGSRSEGHAHGAEPGVRNAGGKSASRRR